MKQLITILSLTLFIGCVSKPLVAPSQNKALNSISKSNAGKKKSYYMQKETDAFLDKEWKETVGKDKEIQKKYTDKEDRNFTIQEYVDKAEVYNKKKPTNTTTSNVSKLESLPVIGK